MLAIQCEVELQHVHPWFAEESELTSLGMGLDHLPQVGLGDSALAGDTRQLELGCRR